MIAHAIRGGMVVEGSLSVDIVGRACRLPGARDVDAFWQLLAAGQCSVSAIPDDRWLKEVFFNPRRGERGKTYTFAAGVLDSIWDFDPAPFGLSQREAEQMDPQQRLLLEVVAEAIADAGWRASDVAGTPIGVYVGASSLDAVNRRFFDVTSVDPYFMTGNTLSLVANRVSYVFDLRGPSLTIDTACSSGMVAFHDAVSALEDGRIDTAIVGGVNLLLSPYPFVGFSAASMLSPEGLCRPFDANGQGYVRAEGCVAFVLQRRDSKTISGRRRHGTVVATGTNSDGRTVGVALPSSVAQARLLRDLYGSRHLDPGALAFIEAHGTGTRVGDPAEAKALGESLGSRRRAPLPIGSVKSNIGHLEPVAGLAGLLKAMLALEHDELPATLHFDQPNPDIPFDALNLRVTSRREPLPRGEGPRLAGVNSFGFGGTNAHAVITDPPRAATLADVGAPRVRPSESGAIAVLSAYDEDALTALAKTYADRLAALSDDDRHSLVAETVHGRDAASHRLVALAPTGDALIERLRVRAADVDGKPIDGVVSGRAVAAAARTAFVFNGNGSQWAGMGRVAFATNAGFRDSVERIDALFARRAGWSLLEAMHDPGLAERLPRTDVAQPLLFAVQVGVASALGEFGLKPDFVLGHSVGEVAAAHVAGILSLEDAVRVIQARSSAQELARDSGLMAAVQLPPADVETRLADDPRWRGIEIAAVNSPRAVTLAGPHASIEAFVSQSKAEGLLATVLDLAYPFHCALMEPARAPLARALVGLTPRAAERPMISTVTGSLLEGTELGPDYWWRNVREPVGFAAAIGTAIDAGAAVLLEIGPRSILQSYLVECVRGRPRECAVVASLARTDGDGADPILRTLAGAYVRGATVDMVRLVGQRPSEPVVLPPYPYQRKRLQPGWTEEAINVGLQVAAGSEGAGLHPLIGLRPQTDELAWITHVDAATIPALRDHKVHGRVVVAGAAFAEIALAAGREWLGKDGVELRDVDIVSPLVLEDEAGRQLKVHISPESHRFEIASRPRMAGQEWQLHAAGRVAAIPAHQQPETVPVAAAQAEHRQWDEAAIYDAAERLGLGYGPAFRRAIAVTGTGGLDMRVDLAPATGEWGSRVALELDPTGLDAIFHGLLVAAADRDRHARNAFVPVRFGTLRLYRRHAETLSGRIVVRQANHRGLLADLTLFDRDGQVVATLEGARFRAVPAPGADLSAHVFAMGAESVRIAGTTEPEFPPAAAADAMADAGEADGEARLLLEAAARRIAHDAVVQLAEPDRRVQPGAIDAAAGDSQHLRTYLWSLVLMAARREGAGASAILRLPASFDLPELSDILATIAADHPAWIADVVLAGRAAELSRSLAAGDADSAAAGPAFATATLDHLTTHAPRARQHVDAVSGAVASIAANWPVGRPLRILELGPGGGALTRALVPFVSGGRGRIVAACGGVEEAERLGTRLERVGDVDVIDVADLAGDALPAFDMVVSANGLYRLDDAEKALARACAACVAGGHLFVSTEQPDGFHAAVLGLQPGYFSRSLRPEVPLGAVLEPSELRGIIERSGFTDVAFAGSRDQTTGAVMISAIKPTAASVEVDDTENVLRLPTGTPIVVGVCGRQGGRRLLAEVERRLIKLGRATRFASDTEPAGAAEDTPGAVERVHLVGVDRSASADAGVTAVIMDLRRLVIDDPVTPSRVWLLLPGGARGVVGETGADASMAAIWAFARTLQNEVPAVDLRMIDWSTALSREDAARRIAELVAKPGVETELFLGAEAVLALRVKPARLDGTIPGPGDRGRAATRLEPTGSGGGLDRLRWVGGERRGPGEGEVEVAVAATGLNFRDVMWTLGLLPDEALEDGFAGPTLGFECAGHVAAVGEGVSGLSVGDPVIALAPSAFASHVTVAQKAVTRLPAAVDPVAAATIPVAFLTSYYALHHLARLSEGEWVLIHGGAGGVGLAAMQIAQWRGARIIATAGSPEKRALLERLGAEHVLDSRSLDFVDEVRRITAGDGVHVVLNSLAGEAMERSLELVRPFGRFLELGKRDYYANTLIGLRPFRRNVSYFGIDADQLLRHEPELADRLLREMMTLFADGVLTPLPFRLFPADEAVDAFRLMQQSGHIGKILLSAPAPDAGALLAQRPFEASPEGAHVVFGGVGGFGFATAEWLVASGARHLVLANRSGEAAPELAPRLAALQQRGVTITIVACDVTDRDAVARLLDGVRKHRPIAGIVHAAMALDDALLANLTPARIATALRPKLLGANHLDELTRTDALDYFVLYSSITTMIGNPGQSAYVAGNAYLEELVRERRRNGLPALAVGWGAISDVGYLARQSDAAKAIALRTGGGGLTASTALAALGRLLAGGPRSVAECVVHVAPMSWSTATRTLKTLSGPSYRLMQQLARQEGSDQAGVDDIATAIEGLDDEAALAVIVSALTREVGRILRLPVDSINPRRPLMDFGMDSLMSAELLFAARDRMRLEIPAMSIADAVTINDIAAKALARLRSGPPQAGQAGKVEIDLLQQHIGDGIDQKAAAAVMRSLSEQDVGLAGGRP